MKTVIPATWNTFQIGIVGAAKYFFPHWSDCINTTDDRRPRTKVPTNTWTHPLFSVIRKSCWQSEGQEIETASRSLFSSIWPLPYKRAPRVVDSSVSQCFPLKTNTKCNTATRLSFPPDRRFRPRWPSLPLVARCSAPALRWSTGACGWFAWCRAGSGGSRCSTCWSRT